jgi:hypothetical protein
MPISLLTLLALYLPKQILAGPFPLAVDAISSHALHVAVLDPNLQGVHVSMDDTPSRHEAGNK